MTVRSLRMNDVLTVCEVEVYSERRGKLHNNNNNNNNNIYTFVFSLLMPMTIKVIMAVVMIHSYIEYDTCISSLK